MKTLKQEWIDFFKHIWKEKEYLFMFYAFGIATVLLIQL